MLLNGTRMEIIHILGFQPSITPKSLEKSLNCLQCINMTLLGYVPKCQYTIVVLAVPSLRPITAQTGLGHPQNSECVWKKTDANEIVTGKQIIFLMNTNIFNKLVCVSKKSE